MDYKHFMDISKAKNSARKKKIKIKLLYRGSYGW